MQNTYLWLSYDLGLSGDYEHLFAWLDNKKAKECGDNLAFIEFSYNKDILKELSKELTTNVAFKNTDRVYVVSKNGEPNFRGRFIVGGRKNKAPWSGYGQAEAGGITDDGIVE